MEVEVVESPSNEISAASIKETEPTKEVALEVKETEKVTPIETLESDINKEGEVEAVKNDIPSEVATVSEEPNPPLNNGTKDDDVIELSGTETNVSAKTEFWSQCSDTSMGGTQILVSSQGSDTAVIRAEKSDDIALHVSSEENEEDQVTITADPDVAEVQEEGDMESALIAVAADVEEKNSEMEVELTTEDAKTVTEDVPSDLTPSQMYERSVREEIEVSKNYDASQESVESELTKTKTEKPEEPRSPRPVESEAIDIVELDDTDEDDDEEDENGSEGKEMFYSLIDSVFKLSLNVHSRRGVRRRRRGV